MMYICIYRKSCSSNRVLPSFSNFFRISGFLLGILRGFVSLYQEIQGKDPKNKYGKKLSNNKTNQDLVSNLIFRMVKHDMLRALRDYGMKPDYDDNCVEWSQRTIDLWKLLALEDFDKKDIDASQKATFMELRGQLPRPLQPMLDLEVLVGSGSPKLSLLPFVAICVYYTLSKAAKGGAVDPYLFMQGRILQSDGNYYKEIPDNLVMTTDKRITQETPAKTTSPSTFAAFAINNDQLEELGLCLSISMAMGFSAIRRTQIVSSMGQYLDEVYETYRESIRDDSKAKNSRLLDISVPEQSGGQGTANGNDQKGKSSPKKIQYDLARKHLLILAEKAGEDEELQSSLFSLCEAFNFGTYQDINDVKINLRKNLSLPAAFTHEDLYYFIDQTIQLSSGNAEQITPTVVKVNDCLSYGECHIKINELSNEEDHKHRHYMLTLPVAHYKHLHKVMYKTAGNVPRMKDPPSWLKKLITAFQAIDVHANWISSLSNTTASIDKLRGRQTIFIADRDYLTAIGVKEDYQSKFGKNQQLLQKQQQQKQKQQQQTGSGKDQGETEDPENDEESEIEDGTS